ncbi:MAG: hypothetical protein MZV63_12180 [Marinilabiliales bacterium]|nr:hypothetical protein [Marinilabiliales bacterium]
MSSGSELPFDVMSRLVARGHRRPGRDAGLGGVRSADLRRYLRRGLLLRTGRERYALPLEESGDAWERMRSQQHLASAAYSSPDSVLASCTAAIAWDRPVAAVPGQPQLIRHRGSSRPTGASPDTEPSGLTRSACVVACTSRRCPGWPSIPKRPELPAPEALANTSTRSCCDPRRRPRQLLAALEARGRGAPLPSGQTDPAVGPHSESALESWGRGELLVRSAAT